MKRTAAAWMLACSIGLIVATPTVAQQMTTPPALANAEVGQCFAQGFVPPPVETRTERYLRKEESERFEVTQPTYRTTQERYMSQEGGQRIVVRGVEGRRPQVRTLGDGSIEIAPGGYTTQTERVMVKEASERIEVIPAQYETVTERKLVHSSYKVWKPQTSRIYGVALRDADGNMITRVGRSGEVLCLVEEPAKYETVTRRVVTRPASTRRVPVPAEYTTITKRVPMDVVVEERPMEPKYDTYRKQVLQTPSDVRRVVDPAEYGEYTVTDVTGEGQLQWVGVLCEINVTREKIRDIQYALRRKGQMTIGIDGSFGPETIQAIEQYQRRNGLITGAGLTLETLNHLGVSY